MGLSVIADSTLKKPVITAPALLARAKPWRRSSRRRRSISWARVSEALASALKAREKRRRLAASSTMSERAVTQTPRPGSLCLRSGTTWWSGPRTKRISPAGPFASRVTMQVRSGSCRGTNADLALPLPLRRLSFGLGLFGRSLGLHDLFRLLDPAGLDAGGHDHVLGVRTGDVEAVEGTLVAGGLGTTALRPADEIVGGAAGQVLDILDVVLAEGHQHGGGDAVDLLQLVGDAQLLATALVLGLDAGQVLLGAALDLAGGILIEAFDGGHFAGVHIGDLLDRAEAFGGEKLAHDLVHVERVHEQLGALGEFLLA